MFLEPDAGRSVDFHTGKRGWIEVITGCMFSGKTEELIRRLNRSIIAKQKVEIFKPSIDTRYHISHVVSHNESSINCIPVNSARDILDLAAGFEVIGIDEVQFFENDILEVCRKLADRGVRVIIAGLDMDYSGKPFACVPQLMAVAEFVSKVHAICTVCGGLASYSFRRSESKEKVLIGEKDLYEARCRECFNKGIQDEIINNPL